MTSLVCEQIPAIHPHRADNADSGPNGNSGQSRNLARTSKKEAVDKDDRKGKFRATLKTQSKRSFAILLIAIIIKSQVDLVKAKLSCSSGDSTDSVVF